MTLLPEHAGSFQPRHRSDYGPPVHGEQSGDPIETGIAPTGLSIEMIDDCAGYSLVAAGQFRQVDYLVRNERIQALWKHRPLIHRLTGPMLEGRSQVVAHHKVSD